MRKPHRKQLLAWLLTAALLLTNLPVSGTVKYYAQIRLQVWQNKVCTRQGTCP